MYLHRNNSDVIFCFIPSHIGITGSGKADQTAKSALYNITAYPLRNSDITSSITTLICEYLCDLCFPEGYCTGTGWLCSLCWCDNVCLWFCVM